MEKINILIFPCGSEVAFEIHDALKNNVNFNVIGASSVEDKCKAVFRNYVGDLPYIQKKGFVPFLNRLIEEYRIGIIFPTHDTVTECLSRHSREINTRLAVPEYKTANICRHKKLIYEHFRDCDFNPVVFSSPEEVVFPAFLKPDVGEGGRNTHMIRDASDLAHYYDPDGDDLLVEYLTGEELTVDCFTDRHGALRFIGPRLRGEVFGGISVKTVRLEVSPEIREIAETINHRLKLRGLWFFQLKKDRNEKYKLLEVSARTSSTMGLYRNLGVNFQLLTAYDLMDFDVEIIENDYPIMSQRSFLTRYDIGLIYDTVYIDFDDTVTRNGEVNEFIMLFIYQQARKGKRLILVTRHEYDIRETLRKLKIDAGLFDSIITLGFNESKADKIEDPKGAIFIDNAYQDRLAVKRKWNLPVFDVDAVQSLVDWRE